MLPPYTVNTKLAIVLATLPLVASAALATVRGQGVQHVSERVPIPVADPKRQLPSQRDPTETRCVDSWYAESPSVEDAGDVNGDGWGDFALSNRDGACLWMDSEQSIHPRFDRVWIVSGRDGALLRTLRPPRIEEGPFGALMKCVGDVDLDGSADLLITAGNVSWIYSGASGTALRELGNWLVRCARFQDVEGGGDLDGDGVADVALLVSSALPECKDVSRRFAVAYSGLTGRPLCMVVAKGSDGGSPLARVPRTIHLDAKLISGALTIAPDRDEDGRCELVIEFLPHEGADPMLAVLDALTGSEKALIPLAGNAHGSTHLRSLPDVSGDGIADFLTSSVHSWVALHCGLTGAELRRHSYEGGLMEGEGTSLSVAGDIDGDGRADYVMAAHENDLDCDPGYANLYSGATGALLRTSVSRDELIDSRGVAWKQPPSGIDACSVSDVDGDSRPDIVLSSPRIGEICMLSGSTFELVWRAPLFERFLAADAQAER